MPDRFERIKELVRMRDELLAERPELQSLQDEINEMLKSTPDIKERNRKLQEMMLNCWYKITEVKL